MIRVKLFKALRIIIVIIPFKICDRKIHLNIICGSIHPYLLSHYMEAKHLIVTANVEVTGTFLAIRSNGIYSSEINENIATRWVNKMLHLQKSYSVNGKISHMNILNLYIQYIITYSLFTKR